MMMTSASGHWRFWIVCALACAGALGVAHALRLLRDELEAAMASCGCATLEQIDPTLLWRAEDAR